MPMVARFEVLPLTIQENEIPDVANSQVDLCINSRIVRGSRVCL